ncbi:MAG: GNAT family N-acetyltransferase [Acidobacteria bacterium]|nr:GNAT family N-acetyltransferase [Acidobacteriota bacterium]
MQYMAQKQSYGGRFPGAEHSIIELAGDRVGRLLIDRHENNIHLIDIAILRASRGRGIGGFILEKLKAESETVSLMVFTTNHGAIRLYRRQGFTIVNDTGSYLEMEWKNAR